MEQGMATHARFDDLFMDLIWETGQVYDPSLSELARNYSSKKTRIGYSHSPIQTELKHLQQEIDHPVLFPDEFYQANFNKHFRDSQIVPVVHVDNEFRFVEDAASVPIFRSMEEGLPDSKLHQVQESAAGQIKKKPTLVHIPRRRQASETTRNDHHQIRSGLVCNDRLKEAGCFERVSREETNDGIVPTSPNRSPPAVANLRKGAPKNVKALEAQLYSECSVGASNDVSYASKRGYEGSDEGSTSLNEESLDEETSDSIVPSLGRTRAKRCRIREGQNLSEKRGRKIEKKMRALQKLLPNCNTVDKASMLDEAIDYLKILQLQVQMMSMGSGFCMPPMMMPHFSRMGALMGCNSLPFQNFPILGTAGIGMTNSQVPMLPVSFSQQPIIPNLLGGNPYFNCMPSAGLLPGVSKFGFQMN